MRQPVIRRARNYEGGRAERDRAHQPKTKQENQNQRGEHMPVRKQGNHAPIGTAAVGRLTVVLRVLMTFSDRGVLAEHLVEIRSDAQPGQQQHKRHAQHRGQAVDKGRNMGADWHHLQSSKVTE